MAAPAPGPRLRAVVRAHRPGSVCRSRRGTRDGRGGRSRSRHRCSRSRSRRRSRTHRCGRRSPAAQLRDRDERRSGAGDDAGAADRQAPARRAAGRRSRTRSPPTRSAARRGPRCSPASTRTTTAPRATTRSAAAATGPFSTRAQPRRLAAGRRLCDRLRRQVAQRPADAAACAAGMEPVVGLVGAGGEGLSSFYDYDVFEPDGTPRHFGDRPADYQTDALTREYALPFIDAQAIDRRPFFLWLAYHPPHNGVGRDDPAGDAAPTDRPRRRRGRQSAIPPPRYARAVRRRAGAAPAVVRRARRQRQAEARSAAGRGSTATTSTGSRATTAAGSPRCWRSTTPCGRILDRLEQTGQLANTVLIFLPDQGVMAGEHRIKRGKNRPYEEAIRIPLLMRGPGIAAGQTDRGAGRQRRPRADDPRARRRRDPARARAADRRQRAHPGARRRSGGPSPRGADRGPRQRRRRRAAGSRSAPTSACAPRATPTSSTGAPASTAARRRSTPRSAPVGRPSASSTTSIVTPTSSATSTAIRAYARRPRAPRDDADRRLERCSGAECVLDATIPGPAARALA